MDFSVWQKELLSLLLEKGLSRPDVYSVMLVLTNEEKGKEMISRLKATGEDLSVDAICEMAGRIAYEDRS